MFGFLNCCDSKILFHYPYLTHVFIYLCVIVILRSYYFIINYITILLFINTFYHCCAHIDGVYSINSVIIKGYQIDKDFLI